MRWDSESQLIMRLEIVRLEGIGDSEAGGDSR